MAVVGMAGLRDQRHRLATTHGRRVDLCPTVCPFHAGRNRRGDDLDAPDVGAIPKAGIELPPRSDHRSESKGQAGAAERPSWDGGKPSVGLMRPLARKFQRSPVKHLTQALSARWAKWFACAIRSIGSSSPGSHAWSVAERRLIPITFGLSSLVRWAAGSVTSSRYHCVASIIVSSTARAMRLHGGASSPSILYQSRSDYGSTRGSMAPPPGSVEALSLGLQRQRKRRSKAPPRPSIQA
jgi:hypothetical protein